MTTYNHAMTISFSVSDSFHGDWINCARYEQDKIIHALIETLALITRDRAELEALVEGYDTYEND